jgi:hypothetical protein
MIRSRPTASFLGPASQPIDPARAPGVETTQSGDAAGAETTPFLAARGTAKPIQLRLGPHGGLALGVWLGETVSKP